MHEVFIIEGERSDYNGTTRKVIGVCSSLQRARLAISDYFHSTLEDNKETRYQSYVVISQNLNDALQRPPETILTIQPDYKNLQLTTK